jgi:hypothetical protein
MQERTQTIDIWTYPDASWGTADLTGFDVEATDGAIGSVDEATYETNASYVVVDTGPWILGEKAMLPAGVIERIDLDDRKVHLNATRDQVRNAPKFDQIRFRDAAYRDELAGYYRRAWSERAW